ncbi:MAG: Asp23/Gls24 family envelope stress response protein [Oscillospiraceae bacterium]|nr:Asp23/Gls24 family envelope stress response protein [Oscillospiraceae bacterium]MDE6005467.1 Asp23/Gls24 family envelope stress response protein [Oscillospiraceae bacterium]MDE6657426.1 Asp23/Gls24 family envelope stress response protein [Oscillospiraceae bacterium]
MLYMENHIGKIIVSDNYLRQLTEQTVLQCFGVAGFAQPILADKLFDRRRKAIAITTKDDKLVISLHVRVIYGVNIPVVIRALMHKVEFVIEDAVRIPVSHVYVYVDEVVEP